MVNAENAILLIGGLIVGVTSGIILILSKNIAKLCISKGMSKKNFELAEIIFSFVILSLFILFIYFSIG